VCAELHEDSATWQTFKNAFRWRYQDVHTDQFHFTKLQTARQGKRESPQEFTDRCRALAQKVVCNSEDPTAQRIHHELTDRMLLASFISDLSGQPGKQVRYANPQTLSEALRIALSVQEAEKQERFNESFYSRFDESVRLLWRSPEPAKSGSENQQHRPDMQLGKKSRSQQYSAKNSAGRSEASSTKSAQTKVALRCFECEGFGHFARECPNRLKRNSKSSVSPGKGNPTERSKRSRSPGNRTLSNKRRAKNSGNAREAWK
jgi:hypothetical protein